MAIGGSIRQIRALFDFGTMGGLSDPQLLERFMTRDGEAAELAFAALIERHGPMVMRVCRRILGNPDDVLDAFQSTFLVLATKASTVLRRESLSSWLHGVAIRIARCAQANRVRRETHERRRAEQSSAQYEAKLANSESLVVEEFSRLPKRYHTPMVLCDLEDFTHEQAASHLGWPVGTVKSRLSRGRAQLRERLLRKGLGCAAIAWPRLPALSPTLIDTLARTATQFAAGKSLAGMVPASIEVLLQGVRRMMLREIVRNSLMAVLALGIFATGVVLAQQPPVDHQVKPTALTSSPKAAPLNRLVTNEIHFVDMMGLDWKEAVLSKLHLVKTGPGFKVWTGDADVLPELRKHMKEETQAPRVTTDENSLATVMNESTLKYVKSGHWIFNKEGGAAFQSIVSEVKDGSKISIAGRKIDQGILVRVDIENQKVLELETFAVPAQINGVQAIGQIQLPSTNGIHQKGEWLIPNGGVLILSVGQWHDLLTQKKTNIPFIDEILDETGFYGWVTDRNYWSSPIIERLVVIDARSLEEPLPPVNSVGKPILPNPLPGFIKSQGPSGL